MLMWSKFCRKHNDMIIWWHLVAFIDHYTHLYEVDKHQLSYILVYNTQHKCHQCNQLTGLNQSCLTFVIATNLFLLQNLFDYKNNATLLFGSILGFTSIHIAFIVKYTLLPGTFASHLLVSKSTYSVYSYLHKWKVLSHLRSIA